MTELLFSGLRTVRPLTATWWFLVVSALVVLPVTLMLDLAVAMVRWWCVRRALRTEVTFCPAGHPVPLVGELHFVCEGCGTPLSDYHAWAPSPCCGSVSSGCLCACGRVCRNPLFRWFR